MVRIAGFGVLRMCGSVVLKNKAVLVLRSSQGPLAKNRLIVLVPGPGVVAPACRPFSYAQLICVDRTEPGFTMKRGVLL